MPRLTPSFMIFFMIKSLLFYLADAQNNTPIYLPILSNSSYVGVRTFPLLDRYRLDPFTNYTTHREVMLSLYYPTHLPPSENSTCDLEIPTTRYMPPATAAIYDASFAPYGVPAGALERAYTFCETNAPISLQHRKRETYPLVLFSPGGGNSRLLYTTIVQEVAREGYIVASIDHPYDARAVEFPDGRIVYGVDVNYNASADAIQAQINQLVDVRVQDVAIVLDALSTPTMDHPFEIDSKNAIMFGHSLGGTTAASAMVNDTRIIVGLNFDGEFDGAIAANGSVVHRPFLFFQHDRNTSSPNWIDAWNTHFSGWKLELQLSGSVHGTFEDLPLLADIYGLRGKLGKAGEAVLGTVPGRRGLEIMSAYVGALAEFVLTGKEGLVSGKNSTRFKEVEVVKFKNEKERQMGTYSTSL